MIFDVNFEHLYIFSDKGHTHYKSEAEMAPILDEERRMITMRSHCLDRWEAWEIPKGAPDSYVYRLLMGRARTQEEKALVRRYVEISRREGAVEIKS